MGIASTRFRHVRGSDLAELEKLVEALPFKVEHKQTIYVDADKSWVIQFVLPESEGAQLNSTDVRG